MTNREVLAKFLKETFNIEIKDNFYIRCNEIRCPGYGKCKECPGDHYNNYFWDKEFINDKPMTFSQYVANLENNVKYIDSYGRVLNPITNSKTVNFFEDQKDQNEETEETNEVMAFTSGEISW